MRNTFKVVLKYSNLTTFHSPDRTTQAKKTGETIKLQKKTEKVPFAIICVSELFKIKNQNLKILSEILLKTSAVKIILTLFVLVILKKKTF